MATGLATLGSAAIGAAGQSASGSDAAMAAPLGVDQTVVFGGARKGVEVKPMTAVILGVAIVSAVAIYAITRK